MRLPSLRSITVRSVLALAAVVGGYIVLHESFARLDATLARWALAGLGFDVGVIKPGELVVSGGDSFDVYAVVTGSCSSAAGVLGIAAVSLVLLPGSPLRRLAGGAAAALLFVGFNIARICSILVVGYWLSGGARGAVLGTLGAVAAVALVVAAWPHRGLMTRVAAAVVGGLAGLLALDVWRSDSYLSAMASYHALAGPMLTFGSLAMGVVLLWRLVAGPESRVATG